MSDKHHGGVGHGGKTSPPWWCPAAAYSSSSVPSSVFSSVPSSVSVVSIDRSPVSLFSVSTKLFYHKPGLLSIGEEDVHTRHNR